MDIISHYLYYSLWHVMKNRSTCFQTSYISCLIKFHLQFHLAILQYFRHVYVRLVEVKKKKNHVLALNVIEVLPV